MMRALIALSASLIVTGCAAPPAPRLYALQVEPAAQALARSGTLSVYVGAVTVPDAVDRPEIVVRKSANEIVALDAHRWAEPLKTALARVLAAQLVEALGTARIGAYPGTALADAAYRVQVDVQRFDSAPGTAATIEAVWSVRRAAGGAAISGRSFATAPAPSGYDGLAAAHVAALETVSADLAAAIRSLATATR